MSFIKSLFSEEDGKASFSRVATLFLLLVAIGWVTHLVRLNHALPDLSGLTLFVSVLYGVNKIGNAIEPITKPTPPAPPAPGVPPPPPP